MSSLIRTVSGLLFIVALAMPSSGAGGTWQPLVNQPPFPASTMFMLTDGSVLCHVSGDFKWWRLKPDANGSYVNGTWSRRASSKYDRLYYAGAVFADGRVIVAGGEYSSSGSETNKTEIFDPVANSWTEIPPPSGWGNIGDAPSALLSDGRFFLGSIFDGRTAFYDPLGGSWTAGPGKLNGSSTEETWVLLPDGTVITPENVGHPGSEKYNPQTNKWFSTGTMPVDLVDGILEIGAGILLPDGRAFIMGATPHSALYTPGAHPRDLGTWTVGPDPPKVNNKTIGQDDGPACLLPNGKVLLALGPVDGSSFLTPTYFFEFDGTAIVRVADPPNSGGYPFQGRMMILPTGQVLFGAETNAIYVYTPDGAPNPAWKPSITGVPKTLALGQNYFLKGRQLNGLSHGVGYGDDAGTNTNYPLVQLTNQASGHVFYCRTSNHSTMGVATGDAIVSTHFKVPGKAEAGLSNLAVVTNGIASDSVTVLVRDVLEIAPASFTVYSGILLSGGLPEVATSDDEHLRLQRESLLTSFNPVRVGFTATSPLMTPSIFEFTMESAAPSGAVRLTIELFNYQTSSNEVVDTRDATLKDSTLTIALTGDLSRFVDQATGETMATITFDQTLLRQLQPWNVRIDQILWSVK